jgi:hypothetical protein
LFILQRTGGVHPPEDRRGSFSRGKEAFILQRTGGVHPPEDRRGSFFIVVVFLLLNL